MGSQRKGTKDSGSRITGQSESPFRDPGPIVNDREEGNTSRRPGNLAGRIQKRSDARSPQPTRIPPLSQAESRDSGSIGARLVSLKAGRGLRLPAPPRLRPLPSQTLAPPHLGSGPAPPRLWSRPTWAPAPPLSRLRPGPSTTPPCPPLPHPPSQPGPRGSRQLTPGTKGLAGCATPQPPPWLCAPLGPPRAVPPGHHRTGCWRRSAAPRSCARSRSPACLSPTAGTSPPPGPGLVPGGA